MIATFRLNGQLADSRPACPHRNNFRLAGFQRFAATPKGCWQVTKGMSSIYSWIHRFPLSREICLTNRLEEVLKGAIFFDHGGAFPYKGHGESINSEDFLTSLGLGLLFNFNKYINGRVFWGVPLDDHEGNSAGMVNFYLWANIL